MIVGIGSDIISIDRVRKACEKEAFLVRCFTDKEIESSCKKASTLAGNFAVKEAVAKVFGTGFRTFMPIDIEVLRDELGKPYVNLYNGAKKMAEELEIKHIHVTISNEKEYAVAFAVGEK